MTPNTYEQTKQAEPAEALEALIDVHGLTRVVELLGDICSEKAQHIDENWQDGPLAAKWQKAANWLHKQQFDGRL